MEKALQSHGARPIPRRAIITAWDDSVLIRVSSAILASRTLSRAYTCTAMDAPDSEQQSKPITFVCFLYYLPELYAIVPQAHGCDRRSSTRCRYAHHQASDRALAAGSFFCGAFVSVFLSPITHLRKIVLSVHLAPKLTKVFTQTSSPAGMARALSPLEWTSSKSDFCSFFLRRGDTPCSAHAVLCFLFYWALHRSSMLGHAAVPGDPICYQAIARLKHQY